jgi:hypothetical protein
MEDRGSNETKRHESEKYRYFWVVGNQRTLAKNAGEEFMLPIKPSMMNIR